MRDELPPSPDGENNRRRGKRLPPLEKQLSLFTIIGKVEAANVITYDDKVYVIDVAKVYLLFKKQYRYRVGVDIVLI